LKPGSHGEETPPAGGQPLIDTGPGTATDALTDPAPAAAAAGSEPRAGEDYFHADRETASAFDRVWSPPPGWRGRLATVNNIPIAQRYMLASFAFFLTGGAMALLMRWQLAVPGNDFLNAETYNQLFTMHGTTMMFLFVIPFIEAVANYFMPLTLGTRDLPYPRLTTLAFWTYLWGGLFIYASFLFGVAPAGGWFAYVPMTNRTFMPGLGMDFWDIGLSVAEIAAMGAAAEIIVAILRMRAPGMALHRMPIFAWSMLITAFMIIFAFTPLIVATAMLEFDRKGLTSFFVPEAGGEPLLWQHLFWIFGHPEVYIMFIPAIGLVSQIIPVFARRPLTSYTLVLLALIATGFLSFGLWVHHMFATGLSPTAYGFFAAASMIIAIPTGVQFFVWISTLWTGRPVFRTPLLFVMGFLVIFVLGGVTGVMLGAPAFDFQAHDSYFVVAHLHYVLIGGVIFPFYAGLYYWLPKVTGRMLSERLGKVNFWMMFVFFHLAFFPQHIAGMLGMPRRVYTYPAGLGWEPYNLLSTIGAFGFAIGALLLVVNVLWSRRNGERAGPNPWGADTLEWWEQSPPPAAQFRFIPFVRGRHPLWEQQSLAPVHVGEAATMNVLRSRPTGWRGALVVSVIDGAPLAIVKMPHPTLAPFAMSIGFLLLFAAALVENLWIAAAGLLLTAGSLYAWFQPRADDARAMQEMEGAEEGTLPLAVAGPLSNGWWGTLVFLLVLAVALFTFVGVHFYLGGGAIGALGPPPLEPALWTALGTSAAGGAAWLAASGIRRRSWGRARTGMAAALLLFGITVPISLAGWKGMGLTAAESAYASSFVGLLSFHWVVVALLVGMLAAALLWSVGRPADARGHAVALNAELVAYFTAASWIVVLLTLYIFPRLW
jgi:cytochrome c oxidase subunit I+III